MNRIRPSTEVTAPAIGNVVYITTQLATTSDLLSTVYQTHCGERLSRDCSIGSRKIVAVSVLPQPI